MVGYGENSPEHVHHRTAQGSYCDNMNEPETARHTLYGALVGGPDANDNYEDVVTDYNKNEVADDYNAGFVGALSCLYKEFHGQTLVDFGAVENVAAEEMYVEACVNVSGSDFVEIRAYVHNESAWPARVMENAELRYYLDLSEIYEAGGSAENITITTNYTEGATAGELVCQNEEKHIYYVPVSFAGTKIYPGGQSAYKKEVQFRIQNSGGVWDNTNDPSYEELVGNNGSTLVKCYHIGLYDDGKLVFGTEPDSDGGFGTVISYGGAGNYESGQNTSDTGENVTTGQNSGTTAKMATSEKISLESTGNTQADGNTISLSYTLTNLSDGALDLTGLAICYYFTDEGDSVAECDYSCIVNGNSYESLSGVSGTISGYTGTDCDSVCTVTASDSKLLEAGGTWTIQVRIHRSDWQNYITGNDYSDGNLDNVAVLYKNELIMGSKP